VLSQSQFLFQLLKANDILSAIYCASKHTCLILFLGHKNLVLKTLLSTEWLKLMHLLYNLTIIILAAIWDAILSLLPHNGYQK